MRGRVVSSLALAAALAGCSHKAAEAPPPPPPAPVVTYAALPAFATPGMTIPAQLPDGSYPTPNQGLAGAAALWHLRGALNVAALSCPGEQGVRLTAAYNGWIKAAAAPLAAAYKALASQPGFDDAQTRLYNYYAQLPARPAFCAAAEAATASLADAAQFNARAPATLAALDRPYTDFYRAYDAWRNHEPLEAPLQPRVILAAAAVPPTVPAVAARVASAPAAHATAIAYAKPAPVAFHRIEVDPSVFRD